MNNVELLKQKYVQAEQLYNNNDYEKAITLYKEIIADNTLNDPCTNFEDSTVLYNINISSCHRLAYSYIFLVKHEEALKYFYIIEKEYPDSVPVLKDIMQVYFSQNKLQEAFKYGQKILKTATSEDYDVLYLLLQIHSKLNNFKEVEKMGEYLIVNYPDKNQEQIYNLLLNAYSFSKKILNELDLIKQLQQLRPDKKEYTIFEAEWYYNQKDFEKFVTKIESMLNMPLPFITEKLVAMLKEVHNDTDKNRVSNIMLKLKKLNIPV